MDNVVERCSKEIEKETSKKEMLIKENTELRERVFQF
jgi:hypothetical protein